MSALTPRSTTSGEYQRFLDVGKLETGGSGDIDPLMLGLNATF